MTYFGGEYNKAIQVKRIPNGYLPKFIMKKQ